MIQPKKVAIDRNYFAKYLNITSGAAAQTPIAGLQAAEAASNFKVNTFRIIKNNSRD